MASISGAISAIATFASNVNGIKISYDLGAVPDAVDRNLPCALVYPEAGDVGFKTIAFMGNAPVVDFSVTQLVLYAPSQNQPFRKSVPGLITLFDTYLLALKATPYFTALNPGVAAPIHRMVAAKPTIGITEYAGVQYHSFSFKFDLEIYL